MDDQALWHLLPVAILPALGAAMVAIPVWLIRHRRHTAAIRRRMADLSAGRPELTVAGEAEGRRQNAPRSRSSESDSVAQSRAA